MNPEHIRESQARARSEVDRIVAAWPEARVRWTLDSMAAVVLIYEPNSTYIIEVEGGSTRSLWVSHRVTIGPQWVEGWVD